MSLCSVFKIWAFYNCIDGTRFLAESTVDAFGHINIIPRSSSTSVFSWFGFNCDCLSGTNSFAQFTSNTTLFAYLTKFTSRISPKSVFTTKSWRQWSLFKRIHNCIRRLEHLFQNNPHRSYNFGKEELLRNSI